MIQQKSFLGVSLRSRRNRRALVVGYYAFVLTFVAVPLYRHRFMPVMLLVQTFTLGGFFGGIKTAGPVKPYGAAAFPLDPGMRDPLSLNLDGRHPAFSVTRLLDERETTERDHAHYTAFRILRWTLALGTVGFWLGLNWAYSWFTENSPTLLWLLLVYVLSLPQSVILWTEPEPLPEAEMALLRRAT